MDWVEERAEKLWEDAWSSEIDTDAKAVGLIAAALREADAKARRSVQPENG